jgi:hypothetical protein
MIASGRAAFDRATQAGPVVYIAAEGGAGLKRRKDALWKAHGLDASAPLYFIKAQVNLFSSLEDRDAIAEAVTALGIQPRLIVLDTFARVTAGADENQVKDVSQAINVMSSLQDQFGATVLIVHHSGKDESRGMRGSTALLGAVDAEIECLKLSAEGAQERIGRLTVTKQKDGADDLAIAFKMPLISLSDIDADAASLALVPLEGEELAAMQSKGAKGRKLKGNALEAFKSLQAACNESGTQPPIGDRAPKGARAVRRELWIETWRTGTALTPDAFKKAVQRTPQGLVESGQVNLWAGWAWINETSAKSPAPFDTGFPGDMPNGQGATFDDIPFD